MKKRCFAVLLICLLLLSICGCINTAPTQTTVPEETVTVGKLPKDKTYNILFIGNSYTYTNDMPRVLFEKMAESCGYKVRVTAITKGSYTLEQFADPADPYGGKVMANLSAPGSYDYVILQEQSVRPITEPEKFRAAVSNLESRIRAIGAQPILYATWGRKSGNDRLTELGLTNESMTWKLAAEYAAVGKKLDIPVMHVGAAFYDVNTTTDIELYNEDLSHPAMEGSYLAALTLFCGIFGVDPQAVSYTANIPEENVSAMQESAKKVVLTEVVIPEAYKQEG